MSTPRMGRRECLPGPAGDAGVAVLQLLLDDVASYAVSTPSDDSIKGASLAPLGLVDKIPKGIVQALLRDAAIAIRKKSAALIESIRGYSGPNVYLKLNRFLRDGTLPLGWSVNQATAEAKTLRAALEALPPIGANIHRWNQVGLQSGRADPKSLGEFLAALKPGAIYRDPAFLSTTVNEKPPLYPFTHTTIRFDIRGLSGRDISGLSQFPGERELLFLPGVKFREESVRGEFVPTPKLKRGRSAPPASEWLDFVHGVREYFPDTSDDVVKGELRPRIHSEPHRRAHRDEVI
jgi:hypothetical protein